MNNTSTSTNSKDKLTTQQKHFLVQKYVEHMQGNGIDPEEMCGLIVKDIHAQNDGGDIGFNLHSGSDAMTKPLHKNEFEGIACGIKVLDEEYLKGFKPGDLVIIGAGTGMGKSSLTMLWTMNMSKAGHKVAVFNFEDTMKTYENRLQLLARGHGFSSDELKNLYYTSMDDMGDIIEHSMTLLEKIRQIHTQNGAEVFVVDMINDLMDLNVAGEASTTLTNKLLALANELGITIIITAQLRKPSNSKADTNAQEHYLPNSNAIAGFSNTQFRATKIITISPVPKAVAEFEEVPGFSGYKKIPLAIHVVKAREGDRTDVEKKACICFWEKPNNKEYLRLSVRGVEPYGA